MADQRVKDNIQISDKILELQVKAEKANMLIEDILNSYFGTLNTETELGRQFILHGFSKMAVYSDIAGDYLYDLKIGLDEVAELHKNKQ